MSCFVRMVGYGYRWDMEVRGDSGVAMGGLFDPVLMNGATLYLDAKDMQPEPGRVYMDANEILAERRLSK